MNLKFIQCVVLTCMAATVAGADAVGASNTVEQDRAAILAMAGDFKVGFHFEESVTLAKDSKPSALHDSEGMEKVYLLADEADFISLQHLLVVGEGDERQVVKHWRQDWRYEPRDMHAFQGHGVWSRVKLARGERKGAWSQTVYQVDDSPRYSGLGRWVHLPDYSYWESNETWRPLPRREMEERGDYDVVVGRNRHSITPEGWLHEQDNYKLALRDGTKRVLARETGLNSYTRVSDYDFTPADEYWKKTEVFWALVRAGWDEVLEDNDELYLARLYKGKPLYTYLGRIMTELEEGKIASLEEAYAQFEEVVGHFREKKEAGETECKPPPRKNH